MYQNFNLQIAHEVQYRQRRLQSMYRRGPRARSLRGASPIPSPLRSIAISSAQLLATTG